jgi:hypothetical protein
VKEKRKKYKNTWRNKQKRGRMKETRREKSRTFMPHTILNEEQIESTDKFYKK